MITFLCSVVSVLLTLDAITGLVEAASKLIAGRWGMALVDLNSALWRVVAVVLISVLYFGRV